MLKFKTLLIFIIFRWMRGETRILIQTNGQRYKQANQLREAQMNNKHMKRCSNSLVFREIQMKTTMRYCSVRIGELESWIMLRVGGNWGHRRRHALLQGADWDNLYHKQSGSTSSNRHMSALGPGIFSLVLHLTQSQEGHDLGSSFPRCYSATDGV